MPSHKRAPASTPSSPAQKQADAPVLEPNDVMAPHKDDNPQGADAPRAPSDDEDLELEDDDLEDDLAAPDDDADDDADDDGAEMGDDDDDGETARSRLPMPVLKATPKVSTQDTLRLYLKEISAFPMLEPEQEFELARRVRDQGDHDAAFQLVTSHLRLVVKIAMDFQRRWMQNVLDLVQEGNVGLMRAVQKFDPEKGIKFSYYAAFWIKAYILKFIMDNWRLVKIGTTQAQRKLFYNLNKERRRLQSLGFDPDVATLSKNLNVSVEEVQEMEQRLGSQDMSLDTTLADDSTTTRLDVLPALQPSIEDTLARTEISMALQGHLEAILPKLSDKERDILELRLLADSPVTLREIGERYGITRERVRQLETRLLQKLRTHLAANIDDFSNDWIVRSD